MPYLVAGVVLATALGTLNLLLTLAVIRRLREHTELLAGHGAEAGSGIIEAGRAPGDFVVTDTDGSVVRREDLGGDVLVAFFSPDCPACADALPRFVTQAAGFPGGRTRVLAVVSGDGSGVPELAGRLTAVARVVVDGVDGTLARAFQARAFPSWCLLDTTGTVARSGSGWAELPVPVAV
ncbi:TlpA disulfide reductase family protein [Plantactinospora sp. B5E13]|uniref:TlpA disulfide reductase family protein n=1 Tax=unclassified Plantactinospora TaxID=2631981 RepID=UPI00325E0C96